MVTFKAKCQKLVHWVDLRILGWPKSSFGFFIRGSEKPEWTFWPSQYMRQSGKKKVTFWFYLTEYSLHRRKKYKQYQVHSKYSENIDFYYLLLLLHSSVYTHIQHWKENLLSFFAKDDIDTNIRMTMAKCWCFTYIKLHLSCSNIFLFRRKIFPFFFLEEGLGFLHKVIIKFVMGEKDIIHCKSYSAMLFTYSRYNATKRGICKRFVDIESLAPGQNPVCDLSGLTSSNYVALHCRPHGGKWLFTH